MWNYYSYEYEKKRISYLSVKYLTDALHFLPSFFERRGENWLERD